MTQQQHEIYNELLTTGFIRPKQSSEIGNEIKRRKGSSKKQIEEEIVIGTRTFQNALMQLRKICNHPYLMQYPVDQRGDLVVDERIVSSCGKMAILDQLLVPLLKNGHKILIFSQMTKLLDVLELYVEWKKWKYFRIDGKVSQSDRASQIKEFNETNKSCLFLLSTRAGGLGINLTAADTVIIYDSDWNPQVDLQAQDRCHRIGQSRPVNVIRLATKDSVEVKILQRAEQKRNLERIVIYREKFKSVLSQDLIMEDLELLLRERRANRLASGRAEVRKEQFEQATNLSEEDLHVLLDRNPWPNDECSYHSEHVTILKGADLQMSF